MIIYIKITRLKSREMLLRLFQVILLMTNTVQKEKEKNHFLLCLLAL